VFADQPTRGTAPRAAWKSPPISAPVWKRHGSIYWRCFVLLDRIELDADYVEALWAVDQPPGTLDVKAMLRDTLAALEQFPAASTRFRKNLPPRAPPRLAQLEVTARQSLLPTEAYSGRDDSAPNRPPLPRPATQSRLKTAVKV
jgi:hypothetical protein